MQDNGTGSTITIQPRRDPGDEVVGTCAFEHCKRPILRKHKAVNVEGKDFHVLCYAKIQQQKNYERSLEGMTRKERRQRAREERGRVA